MTRRGLMMSESPWNGPKEVTSPSGEIVRSLQAHDASKPFNPATCFRICSCGDLLANEQSISVASGRSRRIWERFLPSS